MNSSRVLTHSQNPRACIAELYVYYTNAGDVSSAFPKPRTDNLIPCLNLVDRLGSVKTQRGDVEEIIEAIAYCSKRA